MTKNKTKAFGIGHRVHTGDIIHNHSIQEDINKLSETGDVKKAMKLMEDIRTSVSGAHPFAPLYRYKQVEYKGKSILTHQPISSEVAENFPLTHKGKFTIDLKEAKAKSYAELESRIRFGDEKYAVNFKEIQSYIGDTKVEDELASTFFNGKISMGSTPTKTNEPFKIIVSAADGSTDKVETVVIDFIELAATEFFTDNNIMHLTLTNSKLSSLLIDLTFVIRWPLSPEDNTFPIELKCSFKLNIKTNQTRNFKAYLEMYNLIDQIKEKCMTLKHLKEKVNIPIGVIPNNIYGEDEEYLNWESALVPRVAKLEDFYCVNFKFPDNFTEDDMLSIDYLELAMNDGSYSVQMEEPLEADATSKEGILDLFFDNNKPFSLGKVVLQEKHKIQLFGVEFNNIERVIDYPPLILKDADRIKLRIENMGEGDSVRVSLIPLEKKDMLVTFKISQIK